MVLSKDYLQNEFLMHEDTDHRTPIETESTIYVAVSEGDLELTKKICESKAFLNMKGAGILSENKMRNLSYHFVISTAMITRFCVQKGLPQDTAYGISDYYIRKMDTLKTIDEIAKVHTAMCYDFCEKMVGLAKKNVISRSIGLCLDYINKNIHSQITLADLAELTNLSECYISRLFAKEMGMSLHDYIMSLKLDKAKNLLSFSEYSITDIANYLAFSSQSHFISAFKKAEGITPNKYRNISFRKIWSTVS